VVVSFLLFFIISFASLPVFVFHDEVLPLSTNVTFGHIFDIDFNFAYVINLKSGNVVDGGTMLQAERSRIDSRLGHSIFQLA
jgi:hypothetical protein